MEQMGPILAQPAGTSGGVQGRRVRSTGRRLIFPEVSRPAICPLLWSALANHRLASARMRRDVAMTERGVWGKVRSI